MRGIYHSELVCPKCEARNSIVKDSRGVQDASFIRRRRCCEECGHRFTTMELIAEEDAEGHLRPAIRTEADEALSLIMSDIAAVARKHGVRFA